MIPFVKAHACGNDFLVVREEFAGGERLAELARRLCSRNQGVGADGVEFFTWKSKLESEVHLFNSDGSMAEISGNGTRCAAAWMAYENNLGSGDEVVLTTDAGPRVCRIVSREGRRFNIASSMGVPEIQKQNLVLADRKPLAGAVVSTGNPHFVIFVDQPDFKVGERTWQSIGEEISRHPAFPQQTNVEFVRLLGANEIAIRIFERGVGPTTSSGTGTCAAAAAAIHLLGAAAELRVTAPGGQQIVHWEGGRSEMSLTGPAELICFGEAF